MNTAAIARAITGANTRSPAEAQVREGLSPPPVAHFGYEYFDPPEHSGTPDHDNIGGRWLIHTGPGQVFEATVLDTNVGPGAWLRSRLFGQGVAPSHMGLILNVLDRDRDGWGEVLFAWEGYESRTISLLEYSPTGFQRAAIELSGGC